jgi:hypothetical protein
MADWQLFFEDVMWNGLEQLPRWKRWKRLYDRSLAKSTVQRERFAESVLRTLVDSLVRKGLAKWELQAVARKMSPGWIRVTRRAALTRASETVYWPGC